MSFLSDIVGSGISGIMSGASGIIDQFVTDPDKKLEANLKLKELEYQSKVLELDTKRAELENTANARKMYEKDSSLQKIFAVIFLVGYLLITIAMVVTVFGWFNVGIGQEMNTVQSSLITMVFTSMSNKVNTIVDFLFGGSQSGDESAKNISKIMNGKSEQ